MIPLPLVFIRGHAVRAAITQVSRRFFQTDRKANGVLYSKIMFLFDAATWARKNILWHKIVLSQKLQTVSLFRPGFSHLVAFGSNCKSGRATPDVFYGGEKIYENGIGLNAARRAIEFASKWPVVDPFCGRGTIVAVASLMGLDATGIDIDPKQIEAAQTLELTNDLFQL
jgi:2-polyprenyl-3-methyl-5-hydroxy-6-metoxy-1,4-benzoquinol methylase